MLPALVHDPNAIDWVELTQLQGDESLIGINGSTVAAYNGNNPWSGSPGDANPLAVRWASPWAGTRAASFRAGRGFLAMDSSPTAAPIGQGAITLAFLVAPSDRNNLTAAYGAYATLIRWGRNRYLAGGTVQEKDWKAWESEDDNTLFEIELGNYDGTNSYIAKTIGLSHDVGYDPDWTVRGQCRDVHGAPQAGAITHVIVSRSADANPIWTVVMNGRVSMRSDKAWRSMRIDPPASWVAPTGGAETNAGILYGESHNGLLWSVGILEREVTGLDGGVGNVVSGEALTIYNSIPWEAAGLLRRTA